MKNLKSLLHYYLVITESLTLLKKATISISQKQNTEKNDFIQITTPPDAHKLESLNNDIKSFFIEGRHFTEVDYSYTIKPNFSTLGTVSEIFRQ